MSLPPVILSPKRMELLNWFQQNAMPLAGAYEGAIHLLKDKVFPGRVHFIAHAVRDIADRLVFTLDPQLKAERVQYENECDMILKSWQKPQGLEGAFSQETTLIDYKTAIRIDSLMTAHQKRRERPSNSELLFRFLMRNEPSHADVNRRLVDDFQKTRNWFMKITHLRTNALLEIEDNKLQTQFCKFEGMLHSFVGNFFTCKVELDEILRQANQ